MDGPRLWLTHWPLAPQSCDLIIGRLAGSRLSVIPNQLLPLSAVAILPGTLVRLRWLRFTSLLPFFHPVWLFCVTHYFWSTESVNAARCFHHKAFLWVLPKSWKRFNFSLKSWMERAIFFSTKRPWLMTTANMDSMPAGYRSFSSLI